MKKIRVKCERIIECHTDHFIHDFQAGDVIEFKLSMGKFQAGDNVYWCEKCGHIVPKNHTKKSGYKKHKPWLFGRALNREG